MKTYYTVFGHWCGYEALLKICDTMEEAKTAVHEAAAKREKSDDAREHDYDTYYIITETV